MLRCSWSGGGANEKPADCYAPRGSTLPAQTLPAAPGTPLNVIIDTDIGSDLDDAHAVAEALRLRQLGYFRIKALTSSTWLDKAPRF